MAGVEDGYPQKNTQPEVREHDIRAEGGTTSITKVYGPGVTVTRLDTGDYKLTWANNPGLFIGAQVSLSANDPTALAGHTVVRGEFETADWTMLVNVTDAADAAHDLAADEYFTVTAKFTTDPNPR